MTRRTALRIAAAVALIGCGFLAGWRFERYRSLQTIVMEGPTAGTLFSELDLTQQQRTTIDSIMAHFQERSDSIVQSAFPQLRAIADSVQGGVETVLNAEQRQRLRESLAKQRAGDIEIGPGPGIYLNSPPPITGPRRAPRVREK